VVKETSMVDMVAKSICDADGYHYDHTSMYTGLAKAAIKAMREPTKAMICAVLDAHDKAPRTTRVIDDWHIMVDEALK
jgi:hypothetical protein